MICWLAIRGIEYRGAQVTCFLGVSTAAPLWAVGYKELPEVESYSWIDTKTAAPFLKSFRIPR